MISPIIEGIDGKAADIRASYIRDLIVNMESKINQETLFNPTSSREINTINLEHNTPLVEHTLGKSHQTLTSSKNESISDPGSVSTTTLFKKPIVFAPNLEWAIDDAVNTVLYENSLLNIFETLERSPGGQALRANTFFRSGAKIQLKLTSSPFHSGKLVFYYIPPGVTVQFRESIYARVQYPCTYADAGDSTTCELNIPFVTIKDFFATQNPDQYSDFGTIGVAVLNPLLIGTGGQTTVNYALSLHPTENQIALPVRAHNIDLQAAVVGSILGSALMGELGSMAGTAISAATGVAAEHGVEKAFGWDETKVKLNKLDIDLLNKNNTSSTKDLNVSAPSLSNMVGLGTEHLSLYPEQTYVKHTTLSSPFDDEMNVQRIAQVPSLLSQVQWSNTTTPNTVLFNTGIDPMSVPSTVTADNKNTIYPTFLAHATQPFSYWRGSIDYHFTFASTQQHKGKLIVAWVPFDEFRSGSVIVRDMNVETLSLYPNEIFDLSLNKEFTFSVPYNTETPYREVNARHYRNFIANPLGADVSFTNYSLGCLYVMVYNRLSNPTTVTPNVNFNIYIKAGPDYQLRALKFDQTSNYEQVNYVTLQSLEIEMETSRSGMMNIAPNRVGMSNQTIGSTSFQDDDSEHDLNKLLSKYYPQAGIAFTLPENTTRRVVVSNLPGLKHRAPRSTLGLADPQWRNLINHFRDIYAFWHGSLNYFIIHNSTVNTPILLTVSHNPKEVNRTLTLVGNGPEFAINPSYLTVGTTQVQTTNVDLAETAIYSHISNLRVNPTVEITAPYRSIYRRLYTIDSVLGASDYADTDEAAGCLDLIYSNPSATAIPISALIFQSVGSDFRFKYLIPPSSLVANAI